MAGYAALLLVQLFFGLFPLAGKRAFDHYSPAAVVAWRIATGAVVLGAIAAARYGRAAWISRGDWPRVGACALLGVALNMLLFLEGLERSTAVNAALLLPLIPVFTLAIAILAGHERFDLRRALGITLACAGGGLVLAQRGPDLSRTYLLGNLLIVANELSYAGYLVAARPLLARHPPIVALAWVFALALLAIPVLLVRGAEAFPVGASAASRGALLYIVVFATVLTYLLNAFALARVSSSTTAAFIFVQPLITIAGGRAWLDEPLPEHWAIAAALTVAGVWLVARRRTRPAA